MNILCKILTFLALLTILQAIFLMFSQQNKALAYLLSAIVYWFSFQNLSYFACIINQLFNVSMIWFLLLEVLYFYISADGDKYKIRALWDVSEQYWDIQNVKLNSLHSMPIFQFHRIQVIQTAGLWDPQILEQWSNRWNMNSLSLIISIFDYFNINIIWRYILMAIDLIRGGRIPNRGFKPTKSSNTYLKTLIKVSSIDKLSFMHSWAEELLPDLIKLSISDLINLDSIDILSLSLELLESYKEMLLRHLKEKLNSITELLLLLELLLMMSELLSSLKDWESVL